MITYTQMLQFVTVVRNKSITKAAEELFVAQPAVSSTIKKIETELNAQLLIYENKQLYLTEAGERAFKIFSEILSLYFKLENFSNDIAYDSNTRRKLCYYASPSIHDNVTPRLQLFDAFPQLDFSIYTCSSLSHFYEETKSKDNLFGIFFIPNNISLSVPDNENFITETITTVTTTVLASAKNTSAVVNQNSITMDELKNLPLIRCLGSDLAIQNHLYGHDLHFAIEVSDSKQVRTILDKRPELYSLGTNIFFKQTNEKTIAIPVENAPTINLVLIYKKTSEIDDEIYSRISSMLRSLYAV